MIREKEATLNVWLGCMEHVEASHKMSAQTLHDFICELVRSLKRIGFRVISVITDNNSINKKTMPHVASPLQSSIVHPHPSDNSFCFFAFVFYTRFSSYS